MGKIKSSVITTVTAGYQFAPWLALEASGEFALSDTKGEISTALGQRARCGSPRQRRRAGIVGRRTDGDARFNQTYYGVTQQQSLRSGLVAYHASKGVYGYALGANWTHQFSPAWSTNVGVTSTWLTDKVADSQVVERRNDTGATLAVLYSF